MKGKQLGSTIGIPTANIELNQQTELPRFGVYAVKINVNSQVYLGCMNIGINPTVDSNGQTKIEIHILDFDNYNFSDKSKKILSTSNKKTSVKTTSSNTASDFVKDLKALKKLYEEGVLTKEEFEKAKKAVLNN